MENIVFVPIRSYTKATVLMLYNNEGEVNWTYEKMLRKIYNNPDLIFSLEDAGYNKRQKDYNAQQIAILFKYIGRPVLNDKNRKLLGIKANNYNLLLNFEQNKHLINRKMEDINKLSDNILYGLGLCKKSGGDFNSHYEFTGNYNFYFTKDEDGNFKMHDRNTLKCIKVITSTDDLVMELLELKNSK